MFYLYDLGPETKNREYKQLVLHTLLSEEKAIKIIKENKLLSNKFIFKEITKDMKNEKNIIVMVWI